MDTGADDRPLAIVGVVASAGGVEALSGFVRSLPADFPAAVLVVLHISESGPSVLPAVLARRCALPVTHAVDGERLRPRAVLVAPPGLHLRVRQDVAELDPGPRENRHRPSADVLLRSIADAWGARAAGVVLSGTMDDGAAGLRAIAAARGFVMAQDPTEAAFPGMPRAAIAGAAHVAVCPVDEMAGRLLDWMGKLGTDACLVGGAARSHDGGQDGDPPSQSVTGDGSPSEFTCPDCGGTLWEDPAHGMGRFRCRVGHTFSVESLLEGKKDAVEAALWAAIVALRERAEVLRRVSDRLERAGRPTRTSRQRIETANRQIDALRALLGRMTAAETEALGDVVGVMDAEAKG